MTAWVVAPAGVGRQRQPFTMRLWIILALLLAACRSATSPEADGATHSDDFHPMDPTTVVLAAGKPQLSEFFAFW